MSFPCSRHSRRRALCTLSWSFSNVFLGGMAMTVPTVSVVDQVSAALSLASLKHEVIASNIANRDTQGYRRLQVSFDAAMERARIEPAAADPTDPQVSLEQDL